MEINKTYKQSSNHVGSINKMCMHRGGSSENECNMWIVIIILELYCNYEMVINK